VAQIKLFTNLQSSNQLRWYLLGFTKMSGHCPYFVSHILEIAFLLTY